MFGGISVETPPYDVIAKKDTYEIRRYHKQFLAQNTYELPPNTGFTSKSTTGFFPLFNFISGNNNTQTKISMTAPVIIQQTENDNVIKRTMSFIMSPSTFKSLDQVPTANDGNIHLVEVSNSRNMACITFNMSMSTEKIAAKEKELREAAHCDGIELSSNRKDVLYFGYNPPYTIPYFRKNEICIPIINQ
ncbi:hypothetical protein I4U23_005261 [Adineta vaga]|nr:hypothetical protein I4U23_005261 [Adineta vaga]